MRRIESLEDDMRGQVTYEISKGRYIRLDVRQVREHGLEEIMKFYGVEMPKGRLPVTQEGSEVGSVPASFEPIAIKSTSFFYGVRPGDFKRTEAGWEASKYLGPGDLEAVPGFQWGDIDRRSKQYANAIEARDLLMKAVLGRDLT